MGPNLYCWNQGPCWVCCPPGFPYHYPSSQNTAATPEQGKTLISAPPPSPQSSLFALRLLCRTRSWAQPEEQSYGERVQRPLTRQLRATSSLGQRWCDHGRRKFSNRNNQASWKCWSLRGARLFAIPWTMDLQAPLFMEFSRQEHWSE